MASVMPGRRVHEVKVNRETLTIDVKYTDLKFIGGGAYGFVCAGVDKETGKKVAIKKIKDVFRDATDAKRILREVKLLRLLGGHQNVIWIRDIMVHPNTRDFKDLYIVTDLMDTDLSHIVASQQTLSDMHIKYFLYQILRSLKFVHSAKVLHRDLKPQNVLVNANCELVVCDFGLARALGAPEDSEAELTSYVVTRWYRAPELLAGSGFYDAGVDMWSVGCILAEILGRRPLFPGRHFQHQLQLIIDALGTPSEEAMWFIRRSSQVRLIRQMGKRAKARWSRLFPHANPQALDLLDKMLMFDPRARISVEDALEHPYLADYHDPDDEPSAARTVSFDFDRMGELTTAYLQTKMIEEMAAHQQKRVRPMTEVSGPTGVEIERGLAPGTAGAAGRGRAAGGGGVAQPPPAVPEEPEDDELSPTAAAAARAEEDERERHSQAQRSRASKALGALGGGTAPARGAPAAAGQTNGQQATSRPATGAAAGPATQADLAALRAELESRVDEAVRAATEPLLARIAQLEKAAEGGAGASSRVRFT